MLLFTRIALGQRLSLSTTRSSSKLLLSPTLRQSYRHYHPAAQPFLSQPPSSSSAQQLLKTSTAFLSKRTMSTGVKYHCVHVFVKTKPGTEDAFKEASLKNARNSAQEPGVVRFDVLQDQADPNAFVLVEVYKDADTSPAAHKETDHYKEWRETVADMMAEPRAARKFDNLFPTTPEGWSYPEGQALE